MRKLYLLLDEWDNDRNFAGSELELICQSYDVTVVCNSASYMMNPSVKYFIYRRPCKLKAFVSLFRMIADIEAWNEMSLALKEPSHKISRLYEAIRFYVNADLFRRYLKKNGLLKDNAIYYSYWYFWKCYAVTHEIDKYPHSKVITRTHEYDLYDYTSPSGYQPFKVAMDAKLDSIIFIAEHGRDYYLKKYNRAEGDKYRLYRLGTPKPLVCLPDSTDMAAHYKQNTNTKELIIVSCSSIIERKRVHRIAEALSLIDDIKIKWIHFGTGDKEEELRRLCKDRLDNKENITYELMGYIKNEELHKYYSNNRVDVFITASASEGNPVSVMEAMSYGIPVIAPAICNFPVMIKDCGILVSDNCSAEELALAIQEIAEMPFDEIKQLGLKAYKCWEEKFNAEKNDRQFVEEVLDKL